MMRNPFKKEVIYVRLRTNSVELKVLSSGKTVKRVASKPFSNSRLIIASPSAAIEFTQDLLREIHNPLIDPTLAIVIQPLEHIEEGISEAEIMMFNDFAEAIGGSFCYIEKSGKLLNDETLKKITQ